MTKTNTALRIFVLVFGCLFVSATSAAPLKDTEALKGLKVAKAVFLIDVDKPGRVAHVFKTIELTDKSLREQGVKPHIVVVAIGPSVAFLTRDRRGIGYMDERAISELQTEVGKLAKMAIPTKACGVAMKGMDVQPGDLIAGVHPVGNGFVEAIGYQTQGYQLVPVY